MKKAIWKFQLKEDDRISIRMPKGAEILSVQPQMDRPCLWALVDPENQLEERFFEMFGTGHPVHYDMEIHRKFLGTFQLMGGRLIFHVFERID